MLLKLIKYCHRFFCLSLKEKFLFIEAVFFLLTAKLMLLFLPFRICLRTITIQQYEAQPAVETLNSFKIAVIRANRLSCWKNICLVQAFAARWMLQRRKIGSSLLIGIKQDTKKIVSAHAWLMVGNHKIVSGANDYLPITKY